MMDETRLTFCLFHLFSSSPPYLRVERQYQLFFICWNSLPECEVSAFCSKNLKHPDPKKNLLHKTLSLLSHLHSSSLRFYAFHMSYLVWMQWLSLSAYHIPFGLALLCPREFLVDIISVKGPLHFPSQSQHPSPGHEIYATFHLFLPSSLQQYHPSFLHQSPSFPSLNTHLSFTICHFLLLAIFFHKCLMSTKRL